MANGVDIESLAAQSGRLEEIRESLEWDKTTIASAIGVSSSQWSNYIKPINGMPPHVASRLCQVAGVSTDFIYRGLFHGVTPERRDAILKVRAAGKKAARRA